MAEKTVVIRYDKKTIEVKVLKAPKGYRVEAKCWGEK